MTVGYESTKNILRQILDTLKRPELYKSKGASIPRGLLMESAPGLGKSLLASVFIKESGRKSLVFRKTSQENNFLDELRAAFSAAKEAAPSILLLEDLNLYVESNSPYAPEWACLQACIDDAKSTDLFVIATTNDTKYMPPSLLRPGRFDYTLYLDPPTGKTAEKIVSYYLRDKDLAEDAERERIANKVAEGLAKDSEYTGARNDAVKLAWDYEKADVEMGGRGSSDWDDAQCQEIKETGKVRGAEGHHQKNVADHPEDQGDPDNIKFYKSRKEHLEKGHNGDFHNSSDAPKIDKDKMLKKTNSKRVFRNEIKGIGIAAAIGIGVGFTIGFAVSLAQTGVTPDSIKYALINGGKSGLSSGIQSTIGYGIGRTVGQLASQALTGVFSNVGLEITENIAKMCNMGAVGAITIGVFSTVQFVKLVCKGESLKTAAIQVGKQALFSLSLLVVSITAQGIFGGPSGIIVSVGVGIIFVTYTIADTVHQRNYSEKLRVYMIEKCKPIFA